MEGGIEGETSVLPKNADNIESESKKSSKRWVVVIVLVFIVASVSLVLSNENLRETLGIADLFKKPILIGQVGGVIVSVEHDINRFTIDEDQFGPKRKLYTVYIDQDTEIFMEKYAAIEADPEQERSALTELELEEGSGEPTVSTIVQYEFSDLKEDMRIDVFFREPVNLEKEEELLADRVRIAN